MHRHGYKGKKFGRERDQREALIKGLADSLVLRESIETTLPKAKEVSSYTEKLITKAKAGGLHNRRQVIRGLLTLEAAHKLVDDMVPKLSGRDSGHLRVKRTVLRRGDGAQMASVSFVDDLSKLKASKSSVPSPKSPARNNSRKDTKTKAKDSKLSAKDSKR
ncbi:MAG: 50S ribosomal protein L17 [Candidatus Saccharimonadales bacterium]|jgi:large subunit ribosomal protein L17